MHQRAHKHARARVFDIALASVAFFNLTVMRRRPRHHTWETSGGAGDATSVLAST